MTQSCPTLRQHTQLCLRWEAGRLVETTRPRGTNRRDGSIAEVEFRWNYRIYISSRSKFVKNG